MKTLTLSNSGETVLLDDFDYDTFGAFVWYKNSGYARTSSLPKSPYLHRLILPPPSKVFEVDHISGNRLDNRRENLRLVDRRQNNWNSAAHRSSLFSSLKGVSWNRRSRKWIGQIKTPNNKSTLYLGSFKHELLAALAYDEAAANSFGDYARLNFPREEAAELRALLTAKRKALDEAETYVLARLEELLKTSRKGQ